MDSRQACLGALTAPERRVLVLRAGVGARPPLTRARVARRLDITIKRVARLERAGLRRLRGLCTGASGAAGGASGELVSGDVSAAIAGLGEDGSAPGNGSSGSGASPGAGHSSSGGGGGSGSGSGSGAGSGSGGDGSAGGSRGGVEGVSATHPPGGGGVNLAIPLILLALALAAWALTRVLRGRGGAAVVAGPEPEAPKPWRPRLRSTMQGPGWTERPPSGTGDAASWSPAGGDASAAAAQEGGVDGSPPPDAAQPARDESWAARPHQPSRR